MLLPKDALERVLESIQPLGVETVPLTQALHRVAAHRVLAPITLPPFDNSAMDGFALHAAEIQHAEPGRPIRIPVRTSVAAGSTRTEVLEPGTAVRIMTGAPLPERADTVLRLEDAQEEDGFLLVNRGLQTGEHVRRKGEDIAAGQAVIQAGDVLTPAKLGLLAGLGLAGVAVFKKPRVAILTTGNELVEPGEARASGQIYNSNQYALWAALLAAGADPVIVGTARDDLAETEQLLEAALACDVVVTSGGVSLGDFDWVGRLLAQKGTVHFTQVAQQPGKPLTFATVRGKPVFGLPGNPAATMVSMEIYVRPALRRMMGHPTPRKQPIQAILMEPLAAAKGRQQFLRGRLDYDPAVGFQARLAGGQGSGFLSSLADANALLIVPADSGPLEVGATVGALVLEGAGTWC